MRVRVFKPKVKIAKLRSVKRSRSAPLIAVVAILAGCQGLPDFGGQPLETSSNKPEVAAPGPGADTGSDEIVPFDRSGVRRLQGLLEEVGFKSGPIDGIVGPQTIGAIKRYQSKHSLPVTGDITPRLLEHLQATSASKNANTRTPIKFGPKDFPTYQAGTTFVYSNGQVDRVSGVEGSAVKWVRGNGTTYTAYQNFLLPWSNWATDKERGTATISDPADMLWPLRKGAVAAFSATVTVQRRDDPDRTDQRLDRWRCRNAGGQEITVQAGTFETIMFVCTRGATPTSPEIVQTWYYAKNVRHFVRFVESAPNPDAAQSVDLVAVRPDAPNWPPIVRAALGRAVANALETAKAGSPVHWTSSGVDTNVTIEAKSRTVTPDGRPCRRFEQIWSENGGSRHYHALACKTAAGEWRIPGLESTTADLLATSGETS